MGARQRGDHRFCDPTRVGQYAIPKGGNPRGADLQNSSAKKTREDCDTVCNPPAPQDCGGVLTWLPTDMFKTHTDRAMFTAHQRHFLDERGDFANSPMFTAVTQALSAFSAALDNVIEIRFSLRY